MKISEGRTWSRSAALNKHDLADSVRNMNGGVSGLPAHDFSHKLIMINAEEKCYIPSDSLRRSDRPYRAGCWAGDDWDEDVLSTASSQRDGTGRSGKSRHQGYGTDEFHY